MNQESSNELGPALIQQVELKLKLEWRKCLALCFNPQVLAN